MFCFGYHEITYVVNLHYVNKTVLTLTWLAER